MKTPEKSAKPDNGKQQKQLLALGGLSAVFVAVLVIQFGGGSSAPAASAMTAPSPDEATADPVEAGGAEAAPAGAPIPVAKNNAVLSEPIAAGTTARSPFSNFWSVTPTNGTTNVPAISAPTITVNATMPSDTAGLAVIDGQLHFVGDSIQGWSLAEVSPRSVTLRAPAGETVVVAMPLLVGRLALPESPSAGMGGEPSR